MQSSIGGRRWNWYSQFAWTALAFNLAGILWGALARATPSGVGCGGHWQLCTGEVLLGRASLALRIETILFGLSFILVSALWVCAVRRFPRAHPSRRWAGGALALILVEPLVGAGPVILSGVGGVDAFIALAGSLGVLVILSYALVGSLAMVAWHGGSTPRERVPPSVPVLLAGGFLLGMIAVGMSGAVTALGDTVSPAEGWVEGLPQDLDARSSFLIQLRWFHLLLAAGLAVAAIAWVDARRKATGAQAANWRLTVLRGLLLIQLAAGTASVILQAPVWLKLVHLLLAELVWVLMCVCLSEAPARWPRYQGYDPLLKIRRTRGAGRSGGGP